MVYGFIGFLGGILTGLWLSRLAERATLKEKYKEGYKIAVMNMTKEAHWKEDGGFGMRHNGVWFPDD